APAPTRRVTVQRGDSPTFRLSRHERTLEEDENNARTDGTIGTSHFIAREKAAASSVPQNYADSAFTIRGCQEGGAIFANSRGKRRPTAGLASPPRALRSAATWPGSRWTVLCVNQPIPVLNDCWRNSMRLPFPSD